MAVPKAAVDEDHAAAIPEYEVRRAGESGLHFRRLIAKGAKQPAKLPFGAGVARPDQRHPFAPLLRSQGIRHLW